MACATWLTFALRPTATCSTIPESNVELTIERLRWDRDELKGELGVFCGIVGGRAVDGCLTRGTYNLSSQRARDDQAKYLIRRSRTNDVPWLEWLEEFSQRVIQAYRAGAPAMLLRSVPTPTSDDEYNVNGWMLPKQDPTIVLWDAEGGTLPHQLTDGVGDEEGRGRLADAVPSKGQSRPGQGSQLASGAR